MLTDPFQITLGVYFPDHEVRIRVNGSAELPDDEIDFEQEVGLKQTDEIVAGTFHWKFGEKWNLQMQYFESKRTNSLILEEDIEWEDYILREGSSLGAGIEMKILRVFFGRTFHTGPRHQFGAGAGIHWMELDAFAEGEFFFDDKSTGFRRESVSAEAPLPNIGAWYIYSPSARWAVISRFDWLHASIDEYSGGLINAAVGVNYQATEHFGVGVNYQYFELDADIKKDSWRGTLDVTFDGLLAYLSFNW